MPRRAAKIDANQPEVDWVCEQCGVRKRATAHQKRKKYCSNSCVSEAYKTRMLGKQNPNYKSASERRCGFCGKIYHSYNKDRKYCSHNCYQKNQEVQGLNLLQDGCKKDLNHDEIFEVIRSVSHALDFSEVGFGCPDGIAMVNGEPTLFEVKNPENHYGRKGLNKNQRKWAETWPAPVYILRTKDDAKNFSLGNLDKVDRYIPTGEFQS